MFKRKAAAILYVALLAGSALQILQSILVAYFFDPENLAPYRYGILVVGFAYLFALGLIEGVFYFISGDYAANASKYVGNTLATCSLIFLVILVLFHILLKPYVLIHTELAPYVREIGAYLLISFFLFLNLTAHNALVGSDHTVTASGLRLVQHLFRILAIAVALFSGLVATIYELILLIILLESIQSVIYGIALLRKKLLSFRILGIDFRSQYRYSFTLGVAGFMPLINTSLDKIMISAFLGASNFAIYSVSAIELPIASILIIVFGSVFFSTYVEHAQSGDYESIASLWRKSSLYGMIIVIPAGIFIFLFSEALYRLILPEAYFEGHRVLGIYALMLLLRFNSPDVVARALDRNSIVVHAALVMLVVNIAGNLTFINAFGLWGAALATLCGTASGWIYYLARYARALGVSIKQLFPWKPYFNLIAIAGLVFGAARWIFPFNEMGILIIIPGLAAYMAYAFRLLDPSEKEFVQGWTRQLWKQHESSQP